MPRGIRTYRGGRKTSDERQRHFVDNGNTRASQEIEWGAPDRTLDGTGSPNERPITQREVDSTRAQVVQRNRDYQDSQAGAQDASANERAVRENQAQYGERPPENRRRRQINIQGQN